MTINDNLMPNVGPIRIGKVSAKDRLTSVINEFYEYLSGLGANVSPLTPEMLAQMREIPNEVHYTQGGKVYPMTLIKDSPLRKIWGGY